jgi:P27 family predicted phage terminase small subunit
MRGRKPKALQRSLVEGDTQHIGVKKLDRRIAALPKAARGLPEPPSHVTGLAREQWCIWKRDLELMQQDYSADAVTLEGACVNYARAIEADGTLKHGAQVEEPIVDRTTGEKTGVRIKKHPAVAVSNSSWRLVKAFCSDLGLPLASRSQLSIESPDTELDDLLELLSRPRKPKVGNGVR